MPRNTAQQLYDVSYVVYGGERGEVGRGRKGMGMQERGKGRKGRERGGRAQGGKDTEIVQRSENRKQRKKSDMFVRERGR